MRFLVKNRMHFLDYKESEGQIKKRRPSNRDVHFHNVQVFAIFLFLCAVKIISENWLVKLLSCSREEMYRFKLHVKETDSRVYLFDYSSMHSFNYVFVSSLWQSVSFLLVLILWKTLRTTTKWNLAWERFLHPIFSSLDLSVNYIQNSSAWLFI